MTTYIRMTRTDIINILIKKVKAKNYLEIGIENVDSNFNKIDCELKHGVDPAVPAAQYSQGRGYQTYSDIYFEFINKATKYDVIFIDGLHTEEQVDKDIANSLNRLNNGGVIVLHDCSPHNEEYEQPHFCGTVWKSVYKLRRDRNDLEVCVVDTDYGCGIVRKGQSEKINLPAPENLNFSFLQENRKEILNLINESEFIEKIALN